MMKERERGNCEQAAIQGLHDPAPSVRPSVVLAFLLVPFFALSDLLLFQKVLFYFDFEVQWIPFHQFAHAALSGGQSAIWNPFIMLGFPQLAESQLGVFYPVNMLLHWLPNQAHAVALSLYIHLVLAMAATYFLARSCRLGALASLHAAICFGLSGFMFAQFTNYNITLAAAYLPLKLLFITLYFNHGRAVYLLYFALALGAELLVSHANMSFISGVVTGLYFLVLALMRGRPGAVARDFGLFAAFSGLAVALAAVQLLPTLEFLSMSDRSGGVSYEMATSYSHSFTNYLTAFFPLMHGSLGVGYTGPWGFEEEFFYVGSIGILAALCGIVVFLKRRDNRPLAAMGFAGAIGFVLSLGSNNPFFDLYRLLIHVPGFDLFRCPGRWSLAPTLALAVFSGYGLQRLLEYMKQRKFRSAMLAATAPALIVPLIGFAFAWNEQGVNGWGLLGKIAQPLAAEIHGGWIDRMMYETFRELSPLAWLLSLLCALLILVSAARRASAHYCAAAIVVLGLLDMLCVARPSNPKADPDMFAANPPHIDYLRQNAGVYRAVSPEDMPNAISLNNSMPAFYGVQGVRGYAALHLGNYLMLSDHLTNPEILDYVGTRYEIRRGENEAYEVHDRPGAFPRAFLLHYYRIESDEQGAFHTFLRMSQEERRSTVAIAQGTAAALGLYAPYLPPFYEEGWEWPGIHPVHINAYGNTRIEIEGATWRPAFLLLTDMYYPGWQARVNGEPAPVVRLNNVFRGVYIDQAGPFRLELEYRPLSFSLGALLSFSALLGLIVFAWAVNATRGMRRHLPAVEIRAARGGILHHERVATPVARPRPRSRSGKPARRAQTVRSRRRGNT